MKTNAFLLRMKNTVHRLLDTAEHTCVLCIILNLKAAYTKAAALLSVGFYKESYCSRQRKR